VSPPPSPGGRGSRAVTLSALGIAQIFAWGSSFYLTAVLAKPIAEDTGWSLAWIVVGASLGLMVSALVSPRVGRTIDRRGGRPVLAASAVLIAAGQAGLAFAPDLATYVALWVVLGLGMGCGLYDAAFATLGRLYGREARSAITILTLWAGFASTVCWPLSAVLVEWLGWRGTCLAYAAFHVAVSLPIYLLVLRPAPDAATGGAGTPAAPPATPTEVASPVLRRRLLVLLMISLPATGGIMAIWSVHLLTVLQAGGLDLATAVLFGSLVGPAQVGARVVEMLLGRAWHPVWTMGASALLVAIGLTALAAFGPILAIPLLLYGSGAGLWSIARGTLPLALFGPAGYATLMGRLALPILVAQALAPTFGALLLEHAGAAALLSAMSVLAVANLGLIAALFLLVRG